MPDTIHLDGELAEHNVSILNRGADELPGPGVITQIDGNRADEVAARFTNHLERHLQAVARRVESLQSLVTGNAEALRAAVEALRDTDADAAGVSQQATAVVDTAVSAPAPAAAPAGGSTGPIGSRAGSAFSGR